MENQIVYRTIREEDLPQVAKIHKEQFGDHILGQCSIELIALFYKSFFSEQNVFIVAEDKGVIKGFVLGGEGHYLSSVQIDFLKNHRLRCALECSIHPHTWFLVWNRFRSNFFSKLKKSANISSSEKGSYKSNYRLLSIAVSEKSKREGVGRGLVYHFDKESSKFCDKYGLCVERDNKAGIAFYKKMGFFCDYERPTFLGMSKTCVK